MIVSVGAACTVGFSAPSGERVEQDAGRDAHHAAQECQPPVGVEDSGRLGLGFGGISGENGVDGRGSDGACALDGQAPKEKREPRDARERLESPSAFFVEASS
jgi:hypothetical protein